MKKIKILFSIAILGMIVSACGPRSISTQSAQNGSTNTTSSNDLTAAENCSGSVNIQSNNGSASEQYRACRTSTVGAIQIFDEDQSTKSICVFPALNGYANPNLYQCFNIVSAGDTLTFAGLNYNGVYVVDAANLGYFQSCAQSNNAFSCANSMRLPLGYGTF